MEKKNRNSGKLTVKDLMPREKHDVRGGTFTSVMSDVKGMWAAAAQPGTLIVGPVRVN